ncbi:DUF6867 family protein [Defluviicoccus vanus]|uniref:DUF6867 domain-containing protein n=1 Tax=Defluviicoccus vanus TaxID=111831 RepID=A0A7H1MZH9_9PROT|nr:hypothetical protein [Defluviicoccus vanus]QNT68865.1 hypothetical protein HQ394_05225 [Defluviicoccus vanus]
MSGEFTQAVMGTSLLAFIVLNGLLAGGAAWITGKAIAVGWKPLWQVFAYSLLLALGTRFVLFALFHSVLFSLPGLLITLAILAGISALSFGINRARKMVAQYPWLYERAGLVGWRERLPVPSQPQ